MMNQEVYFNGVSGSTGGYHLPPMSFQAFAATTRDRRVPKLRGGGDLKLGIAADDLTSAGWGVVFPPDIHPDIKAALKPLLDHRREQATAANERLFRGDPYCTPYDTALTFLTRYGAGFGPVNPVRLPYYLLLVGSPQQISYSFQYDLDAQYAVGRLYFDHPEDYANYAQTVLDAEQGKIKKSRRATIFGMQNADDPPTASSVENLAKPLIEALRVPGWQVETVIGEEATKARLGQALGGADSPALLFTAGHAMCFWPDDKRQVTHQGALVCSDWPGPKAWPKPALEDHYFAAHDLSSEADLAGMVTFHFACYTAGTPNLDTFSTEGQTQIAPEDFVARLPQQLLSHPKGGALATIGHIDRAWQHSFLWRMAEDQDEISDTEVFSSTLQEIVAGKPIGLAMKYFGDRFARLSIHYNTVRRSADSSPGQAEENDLLARIWAAHYDARGYVLLGDPAARLSLE